MNRTARYPELDAQELRSLRMGEKKAVVVRSVHDSPNYLSSKEAELIIIVVHL